MRSGLTRHTARGQAEGGAVGRLDPMKHCYCIEFAELRCYLNMACEQQPTGTDGATADTNFKHLFHDPDIDDFLTNNKCDRNIEKASAHL